MSRYLIAAVLFAVACDRPQDPESAAARAQLADARAACVQLVQRQRSCTDAFIPALVDLRRELDNPKGIASAPRAELLSAAMEEWKTDSTDSAIAAQCERMAGELPAPAVAESRRCVAIPECGGFIACTLPLMRQHLSK